MKKILLVDTNVSAAPIYRYLAGMDAEVFVVGGNPNDYLARTAKHYVNLDYSNVDALAELVEQLGIDYLVPGCNDRSYLACAEVNQRRPYYGIDTVEATEVINNKERFRRFATDAGIPVPRVFPGDQVETDGQVIVKPVDAFSGRGTTVVLGRDRRALDAAISVAESFSRSGTCIVEEYISGRLYSHTAFVSRSEIVADFVVEEHGTANPFVVDTSRVDYAFSVEMLAGVRDEVMKMAKRLTLRDGLIHTQFIVEDGRFWFVEVTRRCPGDLYSQLIELSTGFPYCEAYARPFLGLEPITSPRTMGCNWITRHTVSLSCEQHLESIAFNMPIRIVKWVPLAIAGDLIKPSPFSRIGLLFVQSETREDQDQLFEQMLGRESYRISPLLEKYALGEQDDAVRI